MAHLGECKTCRGKCSSEAPKCPHCGQPNPLSCFAADTYVETPLGRRFIGDLRQGDSVYSFDAASGVRVQRAITRVLSHPAARIFEVQWTSKASPLRTTSLHPLLTRRGWIRACRLRPGDRVVGLDGSEREVLVASPTKFVEEVFNLHTAGEHNFVAGGVVVHNFVVFPVLRSVLHRLFVDPHHEANGRTLEAM